MFTKTKWQIDTIFYFPISLQPDIVDLCYFDMYVSMNSRLEQTIKLYNIKVKIWISEPGQPFRSLFVLYLDLWTGLADATRLMRSDFMLQIGWIYFYQRGTGAWGARRVHGSVNISESVEFTVLSIYQKA